MGRIVKTEKSVFQKQMLVSLKMRWGLFGTQEINPGWLEGREQRQGGFSGSLRSRQDEDERAFETMFKHVKFIIRSVGSF